MDKDHVHVPMTWGARRAFASLFVLTIAFAAVVIIYTTLTTQRLTREVQSQCRFDSDLAAAPVAVTTAGKASLLGVKIVSDARVAWRLAGCPGRLAPPSPSFARWAHFYHLPES